MNYSSRRYLYIDESGTPYLNDNRSSFFLLVGVAINGFANDHSLSHLDNIFRKFEIDYNDSFHAVDIFEPIVDKKGNISKNYIKSDKKALKFAQELALFIESFQMSIDVVYVRKEVCLKAFNLSKAKIKKSKLSKHFKKEICFLPYSYAITRLAFSFASLNERMQKRKVGSIIFETRSENVSIVDTLENIKAGVNFSNTKISQKAKQMQDNIVSIQFATKKSCYPGLALADIIGYALHQRYARKVSRFKNRGIESLLKVIDKKSSIGRNQTRHSKLLKTYLLKSTLNKISNI